MKRFVAAIIMAASVGLAIAPAWRRRHRRPSAGEKSAGRGNPAERSAFGEARVVFGITINTFEQREVAGALDADGDA